MLQIMTNLMALNTGRNLKNTRIKGETAAKKLSSGLKINSAADDAAGLAISEKMRAQIIALRKATDNVGDAKNLFQTGEGALSEIGEMIIRIGELAVQSANDTNCDEDRKKIDEEVQEILVELDEMAERTQFNTFQILKGEQDSRTIDNAVASIREFESAGSKAIIAAINDGVANLVNFRYDGKTYPFDIDLELKKNRSQFFKLISSKFI